MVGIEEALEAARRVAASAPALRRLPAYARARALEKAAALLSADKEGMARLICAEARKPIRDARREVDRAVFALSWAGGEALRFGGDLIPLDHGEGQEGRFAMVRRFPRGPCLFITPFNFPLNLAVHKAAPAMAVGAPFVLKPAPRTPRTALRLGEMLLEAGWPREGFAVLPCAEAAAEALVRLDDFGVLSFTGSAEVGWRLKGIAGRKRVLLELGGIGCAIVAADADVARAAERCAWGAFAYSGQVCISVQRIIVEEAAYAEFRESFLAAVARLKLGDPCDESVDVGPLIDSEAALRVESVLREAVEGGGRLLCGGLRRGDLVSPAVVESPPLGCRLVREELFGPAATLEKAASVEEAFAMASQGAYGLQAGLFTGRLDSVLSGWEGLEVGGLIVNDAPTYRSDAMPYGGWKASGLGREGLRWAMEELTERRVLVVRS
jgi:glyceraldehyde-3-phosphate dehydrogenase (NADP+)